MPEGTKDGGEASPSGAADHASPPQDHHHRTRPVHLIQPVRLREREGRAAGPRTAVDTSSLTRDFISFRSTRSAIRPLNQPVRLRKRGSGNRATAPPSSDAPSEPPSRR
eukprot:3712152-Prymnesium_polylepis.1